MDISLLFITFYGLIEYIADIYDIFYQKLNNNTKNYNISFIGEFPYLRYLNDEKLSLEQIMSKLSIIITQKKITHIFWFTLPDDERMMLLLKKNFPNIKFIFYNFDDPRSFNIFLIKRAVTIDYFINPHKHNEKKYTYVLDKQIHTLPNYIDEDTLVMATNEENDIQNNTEILDNEEIIDVTILVDDNIENYDKTELNTLGKYIAEIKKKCVIENDYSIRLFGNKNLESLYPDIYESEIDLLNEIFIYKTSKIIVILDFYNGLDKRICKNIVLNASSCDNNIPIFMNHIHYGYEYEYHNIPNITFFDYDQIDTILNYLKYYDDKQKELELAQKLAIKNVNEKINNEKINIEQWVNKILDLIIEHHDITFHHKNK